MRLHETSVHVHTFTHKSEYVDIKATAKPHIPKDSQRNVQFDLKHTYTYILSISTGIHTHTDSIKRSVCSLFIVYIFDRVPDNKAKIAD